MFRDVCDIAEHTCFTLIETFARSGIANIPVARVVASLYQNLLFVQADENDGNICGRAGAGLVD